MKETNEYKIDVIAEFISSGEALYGKHWQNALSLALNLKDSKRMRVWLSGSKPIPHGIWDELIQMLEANQNKIAISIESIKHIKTVHENNQSTN